MANKSDKKKGLTTSHKLLSEDYKQQTEAMGSSEALLRILIDNLPFDVFLIGRDGRYVLQNTACRDNWGDIIGKRPEDICKDNETLALWKSNNRRAFKGETVEEEVSYKVKDEEKDYYNVISPIREKGKITGILGINIDITKRKQAERALKAEKEFTDTALDAQVDTFFVFDPKTGKAIRWNKSFNRISGYSDDEIRSMKAPESYYSKDDLKKATVAIENVRQEGSAVVEISLIKKNGETIPTEYIGSALRDEKGNLQYIIAIGRDITKRRQAEEELVRLNDELEQRVTERTTESKQYQLAFQNSQEAIFWADPCTGVLLECNKAAEHLLKKGRNEIIGKHVMTLHPAQEKERYKAMFTEHVTKRGAQRDEAVIVTRSGKRVPVHISSSVISVGDTTVIQGIFTDITERKKTEEDIARQAKLLDLIFKNSLDSIVLLDKDYNFIWVSETYAKSCQRDSSEFAGHNHFEFYPSNLKEEFDAVKKGKSIYRKYARPFIFPDHPEWGTTYWDLGLVPFLDDDGEIEMFLFTLKDVTERKKAQIRLEESERKYRELVEDINDAIYSVDTKGNVVYISPAIKSIIGYEPHELIGKHFSDLVYSEDLRVMKEGFEASLEGKNAPMDYRILKKDGSYIWLRALSKPIKDDNNNVIGIRGVISDITERKHMEEALRLSENQLLKAQHVAGMGFLTWNIKTNEIQWSDEVYRLYGIEKNKQEITLDFTVSLVHPDDLEYVQKNLDMAIKDIRKYDIEHRILRPDGEVIWVRAQAELSRDKDGEPATLLGTVVNITKSKQMEEEANRLRSEYLHIARVSAMGELTASLAHELKQPLAAIRSNAQAGQRFLAKEKPDLDELSEILEDIINDNRRADHVIGRLRMLMRKADLEIAELNINNVIQDIFPLIRSYEIMRNVSLEFELDDNIPSVAGDRIQLQQVTLNLIMNSSEALTNIAGDLRRIVIRTSQKNHNNVTVAIRDNGIGIDEQSLDSLFQPFYTTKQEGMGMGLPISRSIIEAHGGKLWAENNPDRGATFYFTIPVFKSSLA